MPRTLLIIEDVETCADALEIVFTGLDVSIVVAASGEQAWRLLEDGHGDVAAIVTDLEMKRMDGFEVIERVRAHPEHAAIPIMVITGTTDPAAQDRAVQLGANAFYTKPYSPAVVRKQLEQWLNNAKP